MTSTNNDNKEKKMFFTTSDLVSKMNASMKEANMILPASSDDDAGGGFELQRKMPDGSYRRADEKEVAAADFQSKMKQASEAIKTLNPQQKIEWAKYQRTEGNVLFARGEYKEAMDVYLTCLVAMDQSSSSSLSSSPPSDEATSVPMADENTEKTNDGRRNDYDDVTNDEDDEGEQQQFNIQIEKDIKLPVLLNLALSALKLGMLSKAEQFCNHAIETELGKQSAKAHFRRGRVRMLMGHFVSAELDLDKAHELIDTNMIMRNSDNIIVTDINDRKENNQKLKELENEKTVILREKQKLNRLVNHAHKNEKQQKRAMQKLFNSSDEQQQRQHAKSQAIQDLYPEKATPASTKQSNEQSEIVNEYSQPTTYVQWYMQMIGRCAQKILDVIGHGDDEDDEPVEVPVDQDLLETLMNDKKNA